VSVVGVTWSLDEQTVVHAYEKREIYETQPLFVPWTTPKRRRAASGEVNNRKPFKDPERREPSNWLKGRLSELPPRHNVLTMSVNGS